MKWLLGRTPSARGLAGAVLANISGRLLTFRQNRRGSVLIIFAFASVPMFLMIGAGFDYGRLIVLQSQLNQAADAAALAAVSKSANPSMNLPDQATVSTYFGASVGKLPPDTTYSVSVNSTTSVTSLFVTVNYTATLPTTLMKIAGIGTVSVSGSATAVAQYPKYVDFYLLLDNSPSMGLAATTNDISNLQAAAGGCAFACHQHTFDGNGKITGDDLNDNYHIAKNNNIQTRIDVLRTATQQLTTTATTTQTLPNQFRMAVYTFSDVFQSIATLTSNLSSVQTAANAIDLAYAYYDQRDYQTDFSSAMSYINALIPTPGDGSTAATPMKFLFLVTDGVEDKPVKAYSGTGDKADFWKNGTSGWPAGTQANVKNTQTGNVSSARLIQAFNPATCTALKNTGVKIAVLYTTYLPVPTNAFYNQWVAPLTTSIPTNLQSCASPGLYFEVSPSGGIVQAMQQMFLSALTTARLTK